MTDEELLIAIISRIKREYGADVLDWTVSADWLCLQFPSVTREQIERMLVQAHHSGLGIVELGTMRLTPQGLQHVPD